MLFRLTILALIFFISPLCGQDLESPKGTVKQVYSGAQGKNTIVIYKRPSPESPYQIKVNGGSDQQRNFYVIKYASDIFKYLMVEKKVSGIVYYPLVWTDLGSVTVSEIRQRCEGIINGKVPSVDKTDL